MKWIKTHKMLTIVIFVFLVLCIILSFSAVRASNFPISDKVQQGNVAVGSPATKTVNGIQSGLKSIFNFRGISRENERLRERVAELEHENTSLALKQDELEELRQLASILNYESVVDRYQIVTGNVVALDSSDFFNIFTIDRGSESGIAKNDVVVAGNGLIGRVLEVGTGFSKVISIIDEDTNISFQVRSNSAIMGMMSGDGKGGLSGFTFDSNAGVVKGDVLLTTNIGIYPEGIEIGKITSVAYDEDTQLKNITVEPSVSFKGMKKVMVLTQ